MHCTARKNSTKNTFQVFALSGIKCFLQSRSAWHHEVPWRDEARWTSMPLTRCRTVTYRHMFISFPVTRNDVVSFFLQPLGEVRRDEPSSAGDANLKFLLGPVRLGAVTASQLVSGGGHLVGCVWLVLKQRWVRRRSRWDDARETVAGTYDAPHVKS